MIAVIYSPEFLEHDTGYGHPEKAKRLTAIVEALQEVSWQGQEVSYLLLELLKPTQN
jgi:acetoin utilization deacetylase AcuC-like enzyme